MTTSLLTTGQELSTYDTWIKNHAAGTLWQSLAWKKHQEELGREVRVYGERQGQGGIIASALVVIDKTSFGLSTWDIPRGPVGDFSVQRTADGLMKRIIEDANKDHCLSIFLSPVSLLAFAPALATSCPRHEQPEATRIIDLTKTEQEILAQMKPKGRYNISVAQRSDLETRSSTDIDTFYSLLQGTSARDQFGIGQKKRYQSFLENLPGAFLLLCSHKGTPVAGLLGVTWNKTGIYYYGASSYEHRSLMAPYLLQLEAMRHCKAQGCTKYDLLGIAPPDSPADHKWAGISSFKEKFGGEVVTYPQEQQIVLRPWTNKALLLKRQLFG